MVFKKSIGLVIAAMLVTIAMSKHAIAEVFKVEFTQFDTFSIEVVNIDVGDTVEWLPKKKDTMLSSWLAQTWLTSLQNQMRCAAIQVNAWSFKKGGMEFVYI